jgi:hypothetical protein
MVKSPDGTTLADSAGVFIFIVIPVSGGICASTGFHTTLDIKNTPNSKRHLKLALIFI